MGHPGVVVYTVSCPACRAERSHRCRGLQPNPRWRFPHWRRIAVAAARVLLRAAVSQDPLKFALAVEDAASTASAEPKQPGSADRRAALGDYDELAGYHSAGYLLGLADSILGRLDQQTLDLSRQREHLRALRTEVSQARLSATLLHEGLTRPAAGKPRLGLPTPAQAMAWEELRQLDGIRRLALQRDQAAGRRCPHRAPDSWKVSQYLPGGYFVAEGAGGRTVAGWTETPEAVSDTLRAWSVLFGSPVAVEWARRRPRPGRRHPFSGWPRSIRPRVWQEWENQPRGQIAAFATALEELRNTWPAGPLQTRLAEAADRLNAEEPQAPSLGSLSCGGENRAGNVTLGQTQITEWINPAAIAHTGTMKWNAFGSHRPRQVELIASALLGEDDPAYIAANVWAGPTQPVDVIRVGGPAGPMYEIHSNGMHRMHTARLLGFPFLWAIVDQYTLPTKIDWFSLVDYGEVPSDEIRNEILTCWQGALRCGLIDGELDEAEGTLHLIWAPAPWLLARPGRAAAWARNYERAYPGALETSGIPARAWQSAGQWQDWLAGQHG